jgi:hypothetical protein
MVVNVRTAARTVRQRAPTHVRALRRCCIARNPQKRCLCIPVCDSHSRRRGPHRVIRSAPLRSKDEALHKLQCLLVESRVPEWGRPVLFVNDGFGARDESQSIGVCCEAKDLGVVTVAHRCKRKVRGICLAQDARECAHQKACAKGPLLSLRNHVHSFSMYLGHNSFLWALKRETHLRLR